MSEKKIQLLVKRLVDIVVSLVVCIVFLPLWILVAILIKLSSSGPVFFNQERPGIHKKIFRVYKFRTMYTGSEHMIKGQEVMKGDSRVTRLGALLRRTKLDEIPQLINVLKGEMSLIGPRPERVSSLADYDEEISKRLLCRPGMTGLAQVSGNIYIDLQERYKLDVHYVENFNLLLDFKIFIRTIGVVWFGESHYTSRRLVEVFDDRTKGIQKGTTIQ